jgi:hypothetical protein
MACSTCTASAAYRFAWAHFDRTPDQKSLKNAPKFLNNSQCLFSAERKALTGKQAKSVCGLEVRVEGHATVA